MDGTRIARLSPRERECLRAYDDLGDAGGVAGLLNLSTNTVNNHLKAARAKIGATSSRAAARALRVHEGGQRLASLPLGITDIRLLDHPEQADNGGGDLRDSQSAEPWGVLPAAGPPEGRRIAPESALMGLRNIMMALFAIVAAVALMAWLMKAVPTQLSANTFQN